MDQHDQLFYQLIVEVRGASREFGALADGLTGDLGVTAAMRSLMEHLTEYGPQTVPQIAVTRNVSRQHIQILADRLAKNELAEFRSNPGHARSKLLSVTQNGEQVLARIRDREAEALEKLGSQFENRSLFSAISTITDIRQAIAGLSRD